MCNIEEDELPVQRPPRGTVGQDGRTCMKCSKAQAVVVVRLNDPLCEACFMTYFVHKFRATIGKARVIRHEDKVLLAVSGGPCSLAMLRLVCEGLSGKTAKKFRFRPGVLFIDEGALLGIEELERAKIKQEVSEFVAKNGGFDFYNANLEDIFQEKIVRTENEIQGCSSTIPVAKLKHCFNSLPSLTAKEDLLRSLRHQLFVRIALREGYPKVMVGDCASRISVRILSDISQGRGEALPFDTGFVDSRHGNIIIVRPMREFVAKEILLYNFFQGIDAISVPTLATKADCYASIDRLTEEFVGGLQAQFPFTVNTIFRTGDKLTLKDNYESAYHCSLCGVPLAQADEEDITNKVDKLNLEENQGNVTKDREMAAKDSEGGCSCIRSEKCTHDSEKTSMKTDRIMRELCYGCCLTVKDMKDGLDVLPTLVTESTMKHLNHEEMKEQIDEFLLEN